MDITIQNAAKALGQDVAFVLSKSQNGQSITFDVYKKIVTELNDSSNELYKRGANIYYDNSQEDLLAIPFLLRAAKEGNVDAISVLAEAYAYGFGVDKNEDYCVEYLQKGIDAGSSSCYFLAAKLMGNGYILKKDLEKSFKFMKISAEKGNVSAIQKLADKYLNASFTKIPITWSGHDLNDYEVYTKGHFEMGGFANVMERIEFIGKEIIYK